MRTSGQSRSSQTTQVTSSTSAPLQLPWALLRSWSPVEVLLPRRILAFTWPRRTRSWTRRRWTRAETHTPSLFARAPCLSLEDSPASKDYAPSKSTTSGRTNGPKSLPWRTRDITWVPVRLVMSASTPLVDSSGVPSKKSMTALSSMKLRRISGKYLLLGWRTHSGLAALLLFLQMRSYLSVERTQIEMVRSIYSMWTRRTGSHFTKWTNCVWATSRSSSKTRYSWLVEIMICLARCTISKRINGASFLHTTLFLPTLSIHSVLQLLYLIEYLPMTNIL